MDIALVHKDWTTETVTRFFADHIMPKIRRFSDLACCDHPPELYLFKERSAVFRCHSRDRTFAAKLEGPKTPEAHTTEAAHTWLTRLVNEDPKQTRLAVIRPIGLLQPERTLITEWHRAPVLRTVLVRTGQGPRRLAGIRAGLDWLDAFHAIEPPQPGIFRLRPRLIPPTRLYQNKARHLADDDRPLVHRALATLERLGGELNGRPTPSRLLHHDSGSANFLFDGERAIGFDLHETRHDDPFIDFCQFMADCDVVMHHDDPGPRYPMGIAPEIVEHFVNLPTVRETDDVELRLKVHLLATVLLMYGRRILPPLPVPRQQKKRLMSLLDALSDPA